MQKSLITVAVVLGVTVGTMSLYAVAQPRDMPLDLGPLPITEAQLRERLAAEHAASPAGADDFRINTIAAQLEEIEQQRLTDYRIEKATRTDQ